MTWPQLHLPALGEVPDITGLRRTAIVHADGRPYLERHHLIDTRQLQVRIHHWHSGDPDRDLHDHPWDNATVVLAGQLTEHSPTDSIDLEVGAIVTRHARDPHRIELHSADAWTLFITGPIQRSWGFHTADGWTDWHDYPDAGQYEP